MELIAENLEKHFGRFAALDKISFKMKGHGCFGYLGPNGAGKSTTMKIFTTLLRPNGGNAIINGIDVAKSPTKALMHVGALVEDPEPYNFMTVKEFITFAAKIRKIKSVDMKMLNDLLKLPPMDRRCSALSKGQKRRVMIAAIVAQDPDILILDEPSSGLDPAESIIFRDLILRLKKEKLIFLSSHILYEITQTCNYIFFINNGRIIKSGKTSSFIKKFKSKAIKIAFIDSVPEHAMTSLVHSGLVKDYEKDGGKNYTLNFDGKDSTRREIIDRVHKFGIRTVEDAQLGLEKAYLDLIK